MDEDLAKALGMDRPHGALVEEVEPGSPADKAGIKAGDVIVSVDGQDVPHSEDLPRSVAAHKPGTHAKLTVLHDKQKHDVDVVLTALTEEGEQVARGPQGQGERQGQPSSGLGVGVGEEDGKVVVERVSPNGPAAGKLRPGDVIEEINHQPVTSAGDLSTKVRAAGAGKPLLLRVKRGDQSRYVAIERSGEQH
jgi:S1-C subfamily serine protease